jgi:hypothetical protein
VICDRACRDRNGDGEDREDADCGRRRRRGQIAPVVVLDVDIFDRWRRWRRAELVKGVDGPLLVEEFVRWRRRKVLEDFRLKVCWRRERGRKEGETTARVGDMRASRIDPQIGPVRPGRIHIDCAAPERGFPQDRENRPNAACLRGMRINGEIFAIALDRIALKGRGVSFRFGEASDGTAGRLRRWRRRRWRRIGRALEDEIRTLELRGVPRQECALGFVVDRHARLVEDLGDVDAALSHRAG